eukprot:7545058-Pyramimonas_sp.AAC.1
MSDSPFTQIPTLGLNTARRIVNLFNITPSNTIVFDEFGRVISGCRNSTCIRLGPAATWRFL